MAISLDAGATILNQPAILVRRMTMRLYLSSQRIGNQPEELIKLLDGGRRIALIANGAYVDDLATQRERVQSELAELREKRRGVPARS